MILGIFLILVITFITAFSLLILTNLKTVAQNQRNLPPCPRKLPIIGNLHQLKNLTPKSLKALSKPYGDIMFLQLGSVPTLVVSSPDKAREIFKSHDVIFAGRPSLYAAKQFSYNLSSISFAPYGDYWREARRILVLELMTAKRIQSFACVRTREVALILDHIAHGPNPVDLSTLALSLANNVVCQVAFGSAFGEDNGRRFRDTLHEVQRLLAEFNVADYFPKLGWVNRFNGVDKRLGKTFRDMDGFFDKVINEHVDSRKSDSDSRDIVDVMLQLQRDIADQAFALKNEHIKGIIVDIFIAGTDTSAATIIWTMAELMRNPEIRQRAQQEVRAFVKGKQTVQESDIPKLTYLNLVIKESLRLHPPVPLLVPHETTATCTIDNKYNIPCKTRVFVNALALATDPRYWESPERFWPERFLNSSVDYKGQHFEFLPFGAGRRICPGMNFSISLVGLALANLLLCFDWELPDGVLAKDVDMEEATGITTHKKMPLQLVAFPMTM